MEGQHKSDGFSHRQYTRPRTLIGVMALVSISVMTVVIVSLYRSAIKEAELLMADTAIGYTQLIEAMHQFDKAYSLEFPGGPELATLSQVMAAFESLDKEKRLDSRSQEVILGRQEGDNIYFMFRQHAEVQIGGLTVPVESEFALPMRLALAGESGTVIGRDYRDVEVLAAYQPINGLGLGLVVKDDMSEIRAPFYQAAVLASLISILIIGTGSIIFLKITGPLVSQLQNQNESLTHAVEEIEKLEAKFEFEATHDQLTGVSSRRALMAAIDTELERARRYGQDLSVLMCDLDHFKSVNDRYGHPIGDETLKVFASRAKRLMRASDLIGRYGGEEFIVLLPSTNEDEALVIAERLRSEIASKIFDVTRDGVTVTVSIGVTLARLDEDSAETVINRADQALYKAKQNGRNTVVCA